MASHDEIIIIIIMSYNDLMCVCCVTVCLEVNFKTIKNEVILNESPS